MTRTTEKIVVVALDAAYSVFTHGSSEGMPWDLPSDVTAVLTLLPNEIEKSSDCGVLLEQPFVDVVTTSEGKVIDIRLDSQSIGFLAVRTYCLTAGVTPPLMIQAFNDIEDPELQRLIDSKNGVYLLPLFGDEA